MINRWRIVPFHLELIVTRSLPVVLALRYITRLYSCGSLFGNRLMIVQPFDLASIVAIDCIRVLTLIIVPGYTLVRENVMG